MLSATRSIGKRSANRSLHSAEVVEGSWNPKRLVIVKFPSMEQLKAWYASAAYAPALALRKRCAVSNLVMTEGIPD